MADFYCDHQNTALYPTAYMSTPASSASLPQDGDGTVSGTGATPAVSSASWDLTSASASSGTMTVMGATITGLTNSGSGLASAIATAINASTATTTSPNGNCGSVYLKALVWATSSGATLTVYSRIASVALNYANNSACAMAVGTGWTSPPSTAQFSGGVSGPFSYLFTVAALAAAVSSTVSTTAGTYGAMTATVMGAVAAGDKIHIRTKRSGSNVTITLPTSSFTVTTRATGTFTAPLFFVADNGVKWSGDNGVLVITMLGSSSATRTIQLPTTAGVKQVWAGVRLTDDSCNWRYEVTGTPSLIYTFTTGGNSSSSSDNALEMLGFEITGSGGAAMSNVNADWNYARVRAPFHGNFPKDDPKLLVRDFVFKSQGLSSPFFSDQPSYCTSYRVENSKLDHTGLTVPSSDSIVYGTSGSTNRRIRFHADNVRWVGFPASANISGFQRYLTGQHAGFNLRDCTFTNIKVSGGVANGGLVGNADVLQSDVDILRSISITSTLGIRPFVFETDRLSMAWFDSAAPKTTASYLPDGTTAFSLRYAVSSESGAVTPFTPAVFPRLGKHNSLSDGTRTAVLRLLVDNNIITALGASPKNDQIWIVVKYVGTDGALKYVTSRADYLGTPATLTSGSSGDWSAVAYDVNGVTHNYTPYQISVSLPSVKTLTELALQVYIGCQSPSVDNLFMVDPEWSLA